MTKYVTIIIGTHLPKGASDEKSYWKPGTGLNPDKLDIGKAVASAYLSNVYVKRCFHSSGFVRTRLSVEELTGMKSEPCFEISPYATYNDSEWAAVDPKEDKLVSQLMDEQPEFCKKVGKIAGDRIREEVTRSNDGDVVLFETHRGVAEPLVTNLLNQYPLRVPVSDFGQGDLTFIQFEDEKVVGMSYHAASKATAVIEARQKAEERRLQIGRDYADMLDGR